MFLTLFSVKVLLSLNASLEVNLCMFPCHFEEDECDNELPTSSTVLLSFPGSVIFIYLFLYTCIHIQ